MKVQRAMLDYDFDFLTSARAKANLFSKELQVNTALILD